MGIFKKLGDLARSQVNAFLDHVEDSKKLHEQAIIDLEASKIKANKLLVAALAAIKLAEQQKSRISQRIQELLKEAEYALKLHDEDKARTILAEKQSLNDEIAHTQKQIEKEKATITTLHQGLQALDQKISSLKSSGSIAQSHKELSREDAFTTFDRMEEKIEQNEALVEALHELVALSEKASDAKSKAIYDKYSDPTLLEQELEALKDKLKNS